VNSSTSMGLNCEPKGSVGGVWKSKDSLSLETSELADSRSWMGTVIGGDSSDGGSGISFGELGASYREGSILIDTDGVRGGVGLLLYGSFRRGLCRNSSTNGRIKFRKPVLCTRCPNRSARSTSCHSRSRWS
jgi:hypothetical protein